MLSKAAAVTKAASSSGVATSLATADGVAPTVAHLERLWARCRYRSFRGRGILACCAGNCGWQRLVGSRPPIRVSSNGLSTLDWIMVSVLPSGAVQYGESDFILKFGPDDVDM